MGPVVVGVDGSESAAEALCFAAGEAQRLETCVRAVHVWQVPEGVFLAGFAPSADELCGHERAARKLLARAVERAAHEVPGVVIDRVLRQSTVIGATLVDEADGAELLVVGSRGLAGLREALLGSVSHFCCQHAPCPVVVVRHAEAAASTSRSAPTTSPDSCSTPTGAPSSSPSCSTSSTASRVSRPAMVRDLQGYGDRNGRQQEGGNHAT